MFIKFFKHVLMLCCVKQDYLIQIILFLYLRTLNTLICSTFLILFILISINIAAAF